jgi:hypothetical protein
MAKRIADLRLVAEADNSLPNQKARLALLAKMLMGYPMANASEAANEARAEAYLIALDDAPPWAINEAIRRWHRGEGGGSDANYRFAPAPAELRYAVMQILQLAKQTIAHLEALLSAPTAERAMDPAPLFSEMPTPRPQLRAL